MHDIAEFLKAHELFATLAPEELERLAEQVEIEYFEAGATIFRQGEGPADAMWVVRTGAVELRDDGRVLDLLGEGEPFGHASMLSGMPIGWEARARESSLCYRLAAEDVIPMLSDPAGLRWVARALIDRPGPRGAAAVGTDGLAAGQEPVRVLVRKRPVVCEPQVALRDAAVRMQERGVSSILVDLGDGELGIVTDRDLRSRVVAAGLSIETPVGEVMTTPVVTASPELTGDELMLLMIDRGIRHVPVVASGGELLGVATDVDLLANVTHTPILLRRAIADATDVPGLRATVPHLQATLVAMHAAGLAATRISGVLSAVVDALVRRLIELTVAELGTPPAEFGWLSLGSFGRREAVPSSDADSALAWHDAAGAGTADYCHRVAAKVVDELGAMGWQADQHGVNATGASAAGSIAGWRSSIARWLDGDVTDEELVAMSIVLDARVIYGPEDGFDVPGMLREAGPRPDLLRLFLRQALYTKTPTGFLRDIVVEHSGEHAGRFDIKRGGLLPIVNIARYAGLAAGATTTSTEERLRAAAAAGKLDPSAAATLEEAFELFSELRLEHQIARLEAGEPPDDQIDPKTLNKLTRRYLRDAFRAVAAVQKSLQTRLAWNT
jgi:CBS domain-containing protein